MSLALETILAVPVATAVLCAVIPGSKMRYAASIIGSLLLLAVAIPVCIEAFNGSVIEYGMWYVDGLSALFLILISFIGLMVSIYSVGYIGADRERNDISANDERIYPVLFHTFVAVMIAVCIVSSFGMMWIAVEATTLVSAFLVGFYKKGPSTEAAWKYLLICTVGITLALVGIILIYASSLEILGNEPNALDWMVLYSVAPDLDPSMLRVAFVFILVGFGTKMGLVPMHTWLPDAHSQAPTPISAMLSAVLLNCALYPIMRFQMILDVAVPGFSGGLMIGFGLISMVVAAAFILISRNIKRMLAYSSIEHMGIIMIGLGIGTPLALFGALFNIIAHSLTKTFAFLTVGNVVQGYGTSHFAEIRGVKEKMPFTAFMLIAASAAVAGAPPFAIFIGEISVLVGAIGSGLYAVAAAMILLILLIFAGVFRNILPIMKGRTEKEVKEPRDISRMLPIVILLTVTIFLGLFMPEQLKEFLDSIVTTLLGGMI